MIFQIQITLEMSFTQISTSIYTVVIQNNGKSVQFRMDCKALISVCDELIKRTDSIQNSESK